MGYTHRPTGLPGGNPETDRSVYFGGKRIARIYVHQQGPQLGLWGWFLGWGCYGNAGTASSLEEALEIVKRRHRGRGTEDPSPPEPHHKAL